MPSQHSSACANAGDCCASKSCLSCAKVTRGFGVAVGSGLLYTMLGCRALQIISLLMYAGRQLWYSLDWSNAWVCGLPAELLHGVTYSIFNSATTTFIHEKAPTELAVTAQAVLAATQGGLGSGLAGIVAGELYEKLGSRAMYRYCGFGVLAAAVLFALCGAVLDACTGPGRRGDGDARVVLAPQPQPELGQQIGAK